MVSAAARLLKHDTQNVLVPICISSNICYNSYRSLKNIVFPTKNYEYIILICVYVYICYETHNLNFPIKQIATDGAYIYILGDKTVYKYQYENGNLTQVLQKNIAADKSHVFFYITSFFLIDKEELK